MSGVFLPYLNRNIMLTTLDTIPRWVYIPKPSNTRNVSSLQKGNPMSTNNHVVLTGYLGADPKSVQLESKNFVAFSLATQDRYLDKDENWQNKETVWHKCLAFNHSLIEMTDKLKKGMRVKVTGALSYRSFDALLNNQKTIKKQEATIIAASIEHAPLPSASNTQPN